MTRAWDWDARIARAATLAARYAFAADLLRFYGDVAAFQRDLAASLLAETTRPGREEPARSPSRSADAGETRGGPARDLGEVERALGDVLPALCALVAERGPSRLAERAKALLEEERTAWARLVAVAPSPGAAGEDERDRFFCRVLWQAYAESRHACGHPEALGPLAPAESRPGDATTARCPWCGHRPVVGVLRQESYGARRALLCGLCAAEWDYPRVRCAACGEARGEHLVVYTATGFEHVRVDACAACRTYIKTVDLTRDGLAVPLVDELALVPLDLWAGEQGYRKLQPNLFEL